MFYVNDKPEGKFLNTERIKLFVDPAYCYYLMFLLKLLAMSVKHLNLVFVCA